MQRRAKVVSLALFLSLVGCGVDTEATPQVEQTKQNLETPSSVSVTATENQRAEYSPSSRGIAGSLGEVSRPQCCHGQCRNSGGPWVGPWKWKEGSVSDGQCTATVRGFCGGKGYDYAYPYWDPC